MTRPDTGATWGNRSRAGDGVEAPEAFPGEHGSDFDWSEAFDGDRTTLLPPARDRIFHFALYVGYFDSTKSTGLSRRNSATDRGP